MYLSQVVLLLFSLVNIGIGIRYAYRTITFQQYAVGSQGLTTAGIVTALLTIAYGSSLFCYALDITFILTFTGTAISYFIIGNLLTPQLQLFFANCSVAETMGKLYGENIRKIVALCGLVQSMVLAAACFKILAKVISWFFAIKIEYSLFIAFLFVVLNVESSGIKLSTLWGVIRCATFSLLLPMIALILWKKVAYQCNNNQYLLALSIRDAWHTLIHCPLRDAPLYYSTLFIAFLVPNLYPAQVQRILIYEHAAKIKRSFNYAGCFFLSINLFLLWIALLLNKTYGNVKLSNLPLEIFDMYPGLEALFVIGIVALTASSAGANLHAATVLLINDLQDLFKSSAQKKPMMHFSGYTVALGLASIFFALYSSYAVHLFLLMFFRAIVSIPVCSTLMGIYLHPRAVLTGMLAGTISMICLSFCLSNAGLKALFPSTLIHLLGLSVAQAFFKKDKQQADYRRFKITLNPDKTAVVMPLWSRVPAYILRQLTKCNFLDYLQKQLPKDSLPYLLFSFYIVVTGYGFFYTFAGNAIWSAKLEAIVLLPSLFVATFFLVYVSVPSKPYLKSIAAWVWPLSNGYFLFLVGSSLLILSKFAYLPAIILMINIYLAILITPLMVIIFSCVITAMVLWLWRPYMDNHMIGVDGCLNLNSSIVYAILMLFILLGSLCYHQKCLRKLVLTIEELRNGQEEQNARQFFSKQHVEALAYESSYVITQLHQQLLRLLKPDQIQLMHAINGQTTRLNNYFKGIFTHLKHNFYLATNWISIDQLLEECFDKIKINDIYHSPYVVINTAHLYIQCDIERIKHLIINSLHSCKLYESLNSNSAIRKDMYIYINDTQLGYRLTLLQGKIQKVDAVSFVITTTTQRPAMLPIYKVVEMADVQILDRVKEKDKIDAENQHIINSHYGYCEIIHSDSDVTHLYVIPVNVQEITKACAALSPVVYTQPVPLDAISRDEEAAFLRKVNAKKCLDYQSIKDVLQLIKTYYATQRRKTGELFYLHPVVVASILVDITENSNVIMAGLAHDVVENTPLTEAGLATLLGEEITQMVLMAAVIDKKLPTEKNNYPAYIQYVINNNPPNVLLIKLADTLHNAQTIHGHSIEKQIEKSSLIEKFYVPLAEQIGLTDIAHALQLHATKVLHVAFTKR